MMTFLSWWVMVLSMVAVTNSRNVKNDVIAFPGAEGCGRFATGGRGGEVVTVDNLNDEGPGSFREAVRMKVPRIVVFRVSGNIVLKSPLVIESGDLTIAGQSAPGDGVCISNYPVSVNADNVIIRYMRFRLGDLSSQEADALSGIAGRENIIIDHCSISWGTDECASFYKNKNFTMQWCIISESLNQSIHSKGDHGYGGIWGGRGASFHHNLIASHSSRLPRFSGSATTPNTPDELVDFTNNVIYNWKDNSAYGGEKGRYNIVNNFFKPGPATKSQKVWIVNPWSPYGKFYVQGNTVANHEALSVDNRQGIKCDHPDSVFHSSAFFVERDSLQSSVHAYRSVLDRAGASLYRDQVDARVVAEVRSGSSGSGVKKNGIIDSQNDVGGWPVLKISPPPTDGDRDGIPDTWEVQRRLDPKNAEDAGDQTLSSGYDNIEVYLNSLVEHKR